MKYEEIRSDIKDGDVFLFEGTGLFSYLIKLRTKSRVSHVGIALWCRGRLCCIEAREGRGVRVYPLSRYLKQNIASISWMHLESNGVYDINRNLVSQAALKYWGLRYVSYLKFVEFFGPWGRRLSKWIAPDGREDRFYCSEFVIRCLRDAGYCGEGPDDKPVAPGDIMFIPCLNYKGRIDL